MTIAEAINEFIRGTSINSDRTGVTYRTGLNRFIAYLDECCELTPDNPVKELNLDHARDFTTWLAHDYRTQNGQKLTRSSLSLYLTTLLLFYDYLIIQRVISETDHYVKLRRWIRDHLKGYHRPPIEKRLPPIEAVEALLDAIKRPPVFDEDTPAVIKRRRKLVWLRNRAIIFCLRTSGVRVGELVGLRRSDLQPKDQGAWVVGKGKKDRFVRFSSEAWGYLMKYLDDRSDPGKQDYPLFCRHDRAAGQRILPLSSLTVERVIARAIREERIDTQFKITPHSFRHFFATEFLEATGNLALTQDALGHADPSTTRIYAKTTKEQLIDAHGDIFG